MREWYDVYQDEIKLKKDLSHYVDYKIKNKKKLIKLIEKYSPDKKVMEAGCGTGIISSYLANKGYHVTEVDKDAKILGLAQKVSAEYIRNDRYKNKPKEIGRSKSEPSFFMFAGAILMIIFLLGRLKP